MESIGIRRGIALDWFKYFLACRTKQVKINNIVSQPQTVKSGVRQGSVLSANLFITFININIIIFDGQICAFAGNIAFFYSDKIKHNLRLQINWYLTMLRNWCVCNQISNQAKAYQF